MSSPQEKLIRRTLQRTGTKHFDEQTNKKETLGLDFKVGDVFIEVKSYHSDRIAAQMGRVPDIIAVQGSKACTYFANLLESAYQYPSGDIKSIHNECLEEIGTTGRTIEATMKAIRLAYELGNKDRRQRTRGEVKESE